MNFREEQIELLGLKVIKMELNGKQMEVWCKRIYWNKDKISYMLLGKITSNENIRKKTENKLIMLNTLEVY